MRTFKSFITESADLAKAATAFMAETKGLPLYRGMKPIGQTTANITNPTNRKPRDSTAAVTAMVNAGVELAFGIVDHRQTSIFVSASPRQAAVYGNVYTLVPKGDYKILWSPEFRDFYNSAYDFCETIEHFLNKDFKIYVKDISYTFGSISSSLSDPCSGHELISFLKTPAGEKCIEDLGHGFTAKELLSALEKAGKQTYRVGGLAEAMQSQNEIMVYESAGFTAKFVMLDSDASDTPTSEINKEAYKVMGVEW